MQVRRAALPQRSRLAALPGLRAVPANRLAAHPLNTREASHLNIRVATRFDPRGCLRWLRALQPLVRSFALKAPQ